MRAGFKNSQWIVSHGLALNVCPDLTYFARIIPCGDLAAQITSVAAECGGSQEPAVLLAQASQIMRDATLRALGAELTQDDGWSGLSWEECLNKLALA